MKLIGQYLLGLFFIILIIELVLIGPNEVSEHSPEVQLKLTEDANVSNEDASQILTDVHAVETKNDQKEWELRAETALTLKEKGHLALKKVKASFFSNNGVSFEVEGDSGLVTSDTKNMLVDGQVVTRSSNGYIFRANKLSYDSALRRLSSPTPVQVLGPSDQSGESLFVSGLEMKADLIENFVTIEHDIQARKTVGENKKMAVTADQLQISGRKKQIRFAGNVIINLSGLRISGPVALFNYNSETKQLDSIDLEGGVKVSDFSKFATSDRLSINVAKNEYILNGRPRVVQGDDELRGEQIVFLDGGKRVQVQKAKIKVSKESLNLDKVNGEK